MVALNVEHINPFLLAATKVLKDMCGIDTTVGKPYVKETEFTDKTLVIMIGVTGEMRGQVLIAFEEKVACSIASAMMMGMPVSEMDEMATSAICELGNMIMGNTATIFSTKGIAIDITPPTICKGNMSISNNYTQNICIPLNIDTNNQIEINVSIKTD